jgi:xanthine dehydrogenase accessory factor
MPTRTDLAGRAAALAAAGTPFVWAIVVRAERPTSAKAGDAALVLADGELDGFVGGECAESTVRAQALEVLASGETRMLRIMPDPVSGPVEDGVLALHNPCLSGGTLDIFLEPSIPLPVVAVYGSGPIATALLRADRVFGQQVRPLSRPDEPLPPATAAVVVASHGNDEQPVLTAALRAGVPYVGLVASRVRGPAVLESLDVDEPLRKSVRTPAGLDIGARTAPEVALSILAEIVAVQHESALPRRVAPEPEPEPEPATAARDPVCGMPVAAVPTSVHTDGTDGPVYFCGTGCRAAYLDDPTAYCP